MRTALALIAAVSWSQDPLSRMGGMVERFMTTLPKTNLSPRGALLLRGWLARWLRFRARKRIRAARRQRPPTLTF
jgi:hypothetical protein